MHTFEEDEKSVKLYDIRHEIVFHVVGYFTLAAWWSKLSYS